MAPGRPWAAAGLEGTGCYSSEGCAFSGCIASAAQLPFTHPHPSSPNPYHHPRGSCRKQSHHTSLLFIHPTLFNKVQH